jgi:multidrug efflux system outer membrane protein
MHKRALLIGVLFVAGCATPARDPAKPDIELPAAFRGADNSAAPSRQAWWDLYRDEALVGLIREALEKNRDARIAAARVEEARALVGPAELAQLPQLSVGASGNRQLLPQNGQFLFAPGTDRHLPLYGVSVNASYEIDFWGRVASLSQAARADFLSTRYAGEIVQIGLVADVATAYFDIVALRREAAVTRDSIANREKFLDLTRRRYEGGRASLADVARAESSLAAARSRLPQLELSAAQTENRLAVLVGRGQGEPAALVPATAALPAAPEVPAGLPSSLLERRPDILAAGQDLLAATGRVRAQRAGMLPSVSLTGALGTQSRELSQLFGGPAGTWSLGFSLLEPIINADRNRYQVEAQEAREKQAALRYEKAVEGAFREVSDAIVARAKQAEVRAASEAQVLSLVRLADIALKRYEAGIAAYFEVVDAQTDLLNAEISAAEAHRSLLGATVSLYKALGGGWDPVNLRASTGPAEGATR